MVTCSGPTGSRSLKNNVKRTLAGVALALSMHAASWLHRAASSPVLEGGIHPSAITHAVRPMLVMIVRAPSARLGELLRRAARSCGGTHRGARSSPRRRNRDHGWRPRSAACGEAPTPHEDQTPADSRATAR